MAAKIKQRTGKKKTEQNEPTFVLRGRDPLAAPLVMLWAGARAKLSERDPGEADRAQACAGKLNAFAVAKGKHTGEASDAVLDVAADIIAARSEMRYAHQGGKIDVQSVITVHMLTGGEHKGWVHTHGMVKYGKPELEIRGVPLFMLHAAGCLLNEVADYLLNSGKTVVAGEPIECDVHAKRPAAERLH